MNTIHTVRELIKTVNRTHRRLGPLIATNLVAAKAKKCILNVSPAGCGKSSATDTVWKMLRERSQRYTSLTLASLHRRAKQFSNFDGHLVIDDLGGEKSLWSRLATITVLANLTHTHYIQKITLTHEIKIENFFGSASLNIQPILINSLVGSEDWIAVVRDKVLRYYHLIRPLKPRQKPPTPEIAQSIVCASIKSLGMQFVRPLIWYRCATGHRLGSSTIKSTHAKEQR